MAYQLSVLGLRNATLISPGERSNNINVKKNRKIFSIRVIKLTRGIKTVYG